MTDIVVPPHWTRLGEEELGGTILVIGSSDTGKSTLARFLYRQLCQRDGQAAYLDTDVGQSTLGMPTTLSLGLSSGPGDDRFPPTGSQVSYFVGATTPRGHMLPTVVGAFRLQQKALAQGAKVIVVDTTGLVDEAQGGKALKQYKIELLRPGIIVALQRGRELEPLLWPLRREGQIRCVELPVSPHVVERSREARIARRRERLSAHFRGAQPRLIWLRQTPAYDLDRLAIGAFLAFQDAEGFALALGVVEEIDRLGGSIVVRTPTPDLQGVTSVRFGVARWDLVSQREI